VFEPLYEQHRQLPVRFLGLNQDAFAVNDLETGNSFRTVLGLALQTRRAPKNTEAFLLVAADHEALMANILMVHRRSGELEMHRAAHEYFLGNIYQHQIEENEKDEERDEERDEEISIEETIFDMFEADPKEAVQDFDKHPELLEPRITIWREAPSEKCDPNQLPADVFSKFANQVKLVLIGACAISAILNFLY
jgi:hypothetical protein